LKTIFDYIFSDFIAAGSDDGSFFIWDKSTTNIHRVLKGDESIVNCLAVHPFAPYLASSGIDSGNLYSINLK
jgi:WD and tetratricopeptide repeat-containing protein 1